MKQHFYFFPSSIFLKNKKSMHGRVCFQAQSVLTDQTRVSKLGKSVRCAVAVLLLTRWITLSQVLRIRISTLTQSGSAQWAKSGFFVQWVYWVYLSSQNTRPLCNAAMYEQV